jgi:hypothetical protein
VASWNASQKEYLVSTSPRSLEWEVKGWVARFLFAADTDFSLCHSVLLVLESTYPSPGGSILGDYATGAWNDCPASRFTTRSVWSQCLLLHFHAWCLETMAALPFYLILARWGSTARQAVCLIQFWPLSNLQAEMAYCWKMCNRTRLFRWNLDGRLSALRKRRQPSRIWYSDDGGSTHLCNVSLLLRE